MVACRYGHYKIVKLLIQNGSNIDFENKNYMIGFRFACLHAKIPNGTIKFENLKSVKTDCVRGDPDDLIQL